MGCASRRRCRFGRVASIAVVLALVVASCSYERRTVAPELPSERQSTFVYAADGTEITTFFFEENRTNIDLDDMPQHLRDAVIAIEDERFYEHKGVDVRAILRALRENTASGDIAEGGSTITQQYVKTALLENAEQTLTRKVEEASLAMELERQYTKDRILELYLNTIFFGNEAYGVAAASFEYFGKPVEELNVPESALLAGVINSPTRFDPFDRPDAAKERRDLVLDRMVTNGFLSRDEADDAIDAPIELVDETPPETERYQAAYFVEHVKQWILDDPRFGDTPQDRRELLFGGGLRIHTTVDLNTQFLAEASVNEILTEPDGPDASVVAIEPDTGFVRAMVGGRDFFGDATVGDDGQKLNLATQAFRQPGSSFKPIVLATALDDGIPITAEYPAPGRVTLDRGPLESPWTVSNYSGGGAASVTLFEATVRSYNTVFAQLMLDVGAEHAVDRAREYGIDAPIRPFDAAVLGSEPVTPLDMASTYATFANHGVAVPPVFVTKILNPDGTVLYEHRHTQRKVLEAETAHQLTEVLRQNVIRGTGTRARIDRPAAGKTGTTSDWRDAWFVGYTPELATSVWVGYQDATGCTSPRDNTCFMVPPNTPFRVTGGSYPARIWGAFMGRALQDAPVSEFPVPPTSTTSTTSTTAPPPVAAPVAPGPAALVIVPALVGLPRDDAVASLTANGLGAAVVTVADEDAFPDHVVRQDAPAGSTVPPGTVVTLEVRQA